ncbi:MAG: phosphomethylpyrimidine synthase ThiC, partial [Lachnospiraceae bacterium]|nr:phosphomethylpyrimidine synthase ThiC [Lachnospiraceae bacterium]
KGIPGARDWDNKMAKARQQIDWDGMFELAIDSEKARDYFESMPPTEKHTCSMCGKMCAVRTTNKILNGEKVTFCTEEV